MVTTSSAFEAKGIMQQIKELFESGKTSGEIIRLGFAPPTVYKVQRQLRNRYQRIPVPVMDNAQLQMAPAFARSGWASEAQTASLKREIEELKLQLESTHEQIIQFVEMEDELEGEVKALQEQVSVLEPEALAAVELRLSVKELKGQLQHEAHTQASMRQGAAQWQSELRSEQAARREAEEQCEVLRKNAQQAEIDKQRLKGEVEKWQQIVEKTNLVARPLVAEVEDLRRLKVWIGHPCKVCKKPMSGVVSRENAAKAMESFGHSDCLKKDSGSGVGWLLAGSAAIAAVSQARKRS